jgi:low affinity Fe/Cu permease
MPLFVRKFLTFLGTMAASPWAFASVAVYTVAWIAFARDSFGFHGVATLATWCMTLFIQRSEHRDTQALHAKLDELLKAQPGARDRLAQIDRREPEEIEEHREANAGPAPGG